MPTRYNDENRCDPEKFWLTAEEIVARFGGITYSPEALRGIWVHGDQRFEEENFRLFVDVEDTPETAAFFSRFKQELKERFGQVDIWIVSYEVRIT